MSWHFSRALVEEFSEANSWVGKPSVQSSGNPIPRVFLPIGRMKAFSRLSRYGMTCGLLTEPLGEGLLTWYLAGFRAKTSPAPGGEAVSTGSDRAFGERCSESLAKYDPGSRSLRTRQCLLFEDSTESLETLPRWGMMRTGECWERTTPGHLTSGSASGSWPTPLAGDGMKRGNFDVDNPRNGLAAAARKFPTPKASDATRGPSPCEHRRNTPSLHVAVRETFPTPVATDGSKCPSGSLSRAVRGDLFWSARKGQEERPEKYQFPTPTKRGYKGGYTKGALTRKDGKSRAMDALPNAVLGGQGTEVANGGNLNPTWVEWLMGWPLGWTDLKVSGTARFQQWLRSHGAP